MITKEKILEILTTYGEYDDFDQDYKVIHEYNWQRVADEILSKLHQTTVSETVCECKNLPKGEYAISSKALSDPNWTDGQTGR
jgi:hypothetical protein